MVMCAQLFLSNMSTVMLIIAQCEILAKCNHREMLRKINEHKEISAVPQKKFSGNNSKLEVDIIPHAL